MARDLYAEARAVIRVLGFDNGKTCALVSLRPGLPGEDVNVSGDIERFVLATRHEGASLLPVDKFPCFVHIALPSVDWDDDA